MQKVHTFNYKGINYCLITILINKVNHEKVFEIFDAFAFCCTPRSM